MDDDIEAPLNHAYIFDFILGCQKKGITTLKRP